VCKKLNKSRRMLGMFVGEIIMTRSALENICEFIKQCLPSPYKIRDYCVYQSTYAIKCEKFLKYQDEKNKAEKDRKENDKKN
jgi:hypothetical protein